jgi:tetratricopeptide (TPR) repeat protein
MPDADNYQSWHRFKDAMTASARLSLEDGDKALRLLDDAIALAVGEHENRWVLTLSHHAAVISNFLGKAELVKSYYQQSLAFNPENSRALYGLAKVAKEQGEVELARAYAVRCHKALLSGEDFLKDAQLELLLKHWPSDLSGTSPEQITEVLGAVYTAGVTNPQYMRPKPGDMVVLIEVPPGMLDDLPPEDQQAISEVVGKPILLSEYDEAGRAELGFKDNSGTFHYIYVAPEFISPVA